MPVPERFSQARQELVKQLQTKSTPTACVYLLLDLVLPAHEAYNILQKKTLPDIDSYATHMFDLMWEWITRPRTSSELQSIVDMQCLCSPVDKRTPSHVRGQETFISRPAGTLGWCFLSHCLFPGVVTDHGYTVPINRLRRRKQWPRSIRSYLPHGAARTVLGLCQWLECEATIPNRTEIYDSLNNLIHIVQTLVIPHPIITLPFLEAIYCMSQLLYTRQDSGQTLSRMKHKINIPSLELTTLLHNCTILIPALKALVDRLNMGERMAFHHHASAKLLAAYEGAIATIYHTKKLVQDGTYDSLPGAHQHPH
jgi:hypothetical protein